MNTDNSKPIKRPLWQWVGIAAILAAFFVSTLWLTAGLPFVFNSPDENANFVFAQAYAQRGELFLTEPENTQLGGILHPRSIITISDRLVPASFLGLPVVYGIIGSVLGDAAMLAVTPVLGVLAVLAWRQSVFRLFERRALADISALLLMVHPAFWLYTGRTMMHNVAFTAFLIFALWFLTRRYNRWDVAAAGVMIGAALAFRTAEIIWVGVLVLLAAAWIYRRSKSYIQPLLFFAGILVVLSPFALINSELYGSPLSTGYTVETSAVDVVDVVEPAPAQPGRSDGVLNYLFPFGFDERAILRHMFQYGFLLYPWMAVLAVFGAGVVVLSLKKDKHPAWAALFAVTVLLSAWLGIVYGSWSFTDNPDSRLVTLGNSYVRYWLPLFVLSSPFAAKAVLWTGERFSSPRVRSIAVFVVLAVVVGLSVRLTFTDPDGFLQTRKHLVESANKQEVVISGTPEDAVIIVDRADKFIFPHRRVVTPLRSERTYGAIPFMLEKAPVYYFGITLPQEDLDYLNNVKLEELGASIQPAVTVLDETLYHIEIAEEAL